MKNTQAIQLAIETLIFSGSEGNFAILHLGSDYYLQFAANRGDYEIDCEAISNYYIDEETAKLSEEQIKVLEKLGWNLQEAESNFELRHAVDSEKNREDIAALLMKTANLVYGYSEVKEADFDINLE